MTAVTCLFDFQNAEQSGSSQANTNCAILDSDGLVAGDEYILFYHASYGSAGGTEVVGAEVTIGSTVIAKALYTTQVNTTSNHANGNTISGVKKFTHVDTEDIRITFGDSADTSYIAGAGLLVLPLKDLVAGVDYWYMEDDEGVVMVDGGASAMTAYESPHFTIPSGTYDDMLTFMSVEAENVYDEGTRVVVGVEAHFGSGSGSEAVPPGALIMYDAGDVSSKGVFARNLAYSYTSGGTLTIDIDYLVGTSPGRVAFRNIRTFILSSGAFKRLDLDDVNMSNASTSSYDTWTQNTAIGTHSFTPSASYQTLTFLGGSVRNHSNFGYPMFRLENSTDGVDYCTPSACGELPLSATQEAWILMFACETLDAATHEFKVYHARANNNTNLSLSSTELVSMKLNTLNHWHKDLEGFRFRNDDGSESAATWLATQDVNVNIDISSDFRLRLLQDTISAPGINPGNSWTKLQYKRTDEDDDQWRTIE